MKKQLLGYRHWDEGDVLRQSKIKLNNYLKLCCDICKPWITIIWTFWFRNQNSYIDHCHYVYVLVKPIQLIKYTNAITSSCFYKPTECKCNHIDIAEKRYVLNITYSHGGYTVIMVWHLMSDNYAIGNSTMSSERHQPRSVATSGRHHDCWCVHISRSNIHNCVPSGWSIIKTHGQYAPMPESLIP